MKEGVSLYGHRHFGSGNTNLDKSNRSSMADGRYDGADCRRISILLSSASWTRL